MITKKSKKKTWKPCRHGSNPDFCGLCLSGSKRTKYVRKGKGNDDEEEPQEEEEVQTGEE